MWTTVIAVWGAVTGSISLVIKVLDFRKTKPRLKIALSKTYKSMIVPGNYLEFKQSSYGAEWDSAAISMVAENNSKQPVTINKIECKLKYKMNTKWVDVNFGIFHLRQFTKTYVDDDGKKAMTWLTLPFADSTNLPIRIGAYDSVSFKFFIPFIDADFIENGVFKCELKIHTPSKIHHSIFQIPEIHQIVPDLETYIQQK